MWVVESEGVGRLVIKCGWLRVKMWEMLKKYKMRHNWGKVSSNGWGEGGLMVVGVGWF